MIASPLDLDGDPRRRVVFIGVNIGHYGPRCDPHLTQEFPCSRLCRRAGGVHHEINYFIGADSIAGCGGELTIDIVDSLALGRSADAPMPLSPKHEILIFLYFKKPTGSWLIENEPYIVEANG